MRFSAINAEKNINLLIDHQCPQCGAPATLSATDRLFQCGYCRVKSYLISKGYFSYILPDNAPPDKDLIYLPYWCFKGMLFRCGPGGIRNRFVDMSVQAVSIPFLPASLGLRTQALKLKFLTSETPGRFIEPALKYREAMAYFKAHNGDETSTVPLESAIGDVISLIYAPFYLKGRIVYDGILNEPTVAEIPDDFDLAALIGKHPGGQIYFIPTLCPKCGWDLDGTRDSLALACRNCHTIWQADQRELVQVTTSHLSDKNAETMTHLPFWRLKASVSGLSLSTYADLVRLANLPTVIRPEWENIPFYFWGPAFKVRAESYLRLYTTVTAAQPSDGISTGPPSGNLYPVCMPLSEAVEGAMIALASLVRPPRVFFDNLSQIRVIPESFRLVFLPFIEGHHEFIQPRMNFAVNKNQLALSLNR
jgi:hypothetical protein